jgi:spermidine synthase
MFAWPGNTASTTIPYEFHEFFHTASNDSVNINTTRVSSRFNDQSVRKPIVLETSVVRQQSFSVAYSPPIILLVGACFILSGATGLIYEVLWARMLGLVFGATTLAVSTVLAAFMGGLALGSALAGRLAKRIRRPLLTYGLIEIAIAVYALFVPFLFSWIDNLYAIIWQQFQPSFFVFSLWRFGLSCLLLLIPTTLMGATLPVLSAALLHSSGRSSNSVTRLYACNLVGAILGTLLAGFVLLPSLGVKITIVVAAAINAIVGVIAILAERRAAVTQTGDSPAADVIEATEAFPEPADRRFWFFCALVSGFVTISTQVAWSRVLTMVIGSSTYAFSIVVALFLIGLAAGAWMVGRKNYAEKLRHTIVKVEFATAASLFVSLFVINWMPALLVNLGLRFKISSWGGLLALQIFSAGLLILLPALLMGMVMPLVLVWASTHPARSVTLVGRSYAINTIGAIAGAFLTGFFLVPRIGTKYTLLFSAAICAIVAGIAYLPRESARDKQLHRSLAAGLTAVYVILLLVAAPRMNLGDLSIGAYDGLVRVLANTREGIKDDSQADNSKAHRLVMYEEGRTSTVTVRKDWETTSMAINGRANASDRIDMPTQVMLAQIPLLVAPSIKNGLIIGFASGVTVGSMLQSSIETVDCVELEAATIKGSRFFEHVNNRPLEDPRLRLLIDDARTYLRVTPTRYDMIVSEPSHPWVPGVANLFTKEFFEVTRDRLSDQGVFVQWVQTYQLSTETLRSVLATFHDVFPHVLVFRMGGVAKGKDLILVGSNQPLNLDRIPQRISDPRVAAELSRIDLKNESEIRSWFVCDETRLGPAVAGAKINTDDNMHIETTVPREAFRPLVQSNADWVKKLEVR